MQLAKYDIMVGFCKFSHIVLFYNQINCFLQVENMYFKFLIVATYVCTCITVVN